MGENLEAKIVEKLTKGGYLSELRAAHVFMKRSPRYWGATMSPAYEDPEQGKLREIDLVADMHWSSEDGNCIRALHLLVIEVKKTEKPWILLRAKQDPWTLWGKFSHAVLAKSFEIEMGTPAFIARLQGSSLVGYMQWHNHRLCEPFKDGEDSPSAFSGLTQVAKASSQLFKFASNHLEGESDGPRFEKESAEFRPRFIWVQPLLVIDGPLQTAELNEEGELVTLPATATGIYHPWGIAGADRVAYQVDIITLDQLDEYVNRRERALQELCADIHDAQFGVRPTKKF